MFTNIFGEESAETYAGTSDSATTTSNYWPIWVSEVNTATTSSVWSQWTSQHQYHAQMNYNRGFREVIPDPQPIVRTAAEIAEIEATRAHQEEEMRARHRRQKEAEERAEILLLSHLTKQQKEDYRKHKYICFKGRSGANYRIRSGSHLGNIDVMDKNGKEVMHRLCAHPLAVPMADTLLTQLFHLRHHEADFLRIANSH